MRLAIEALLPYRRRKRTDADELLEQFDHFRIRGISPATKELTADDLKMLSEMVDRLSR